MFWEELFGHLLLWEDIDYKDVLLISIGDDNVDFSIQPKFDYLVGIFR